MACFVSVVRVEINQIRKFSFKSDIISRTRTPRSFYICAVNMFCDNEVNSHHINKPTVNLHFLTFKNFNTGITKVLSSSDTNMSQTRDGKDMTVVDEESNNNINTAVNLHSITSLLKEILDSKTGKVSNWVIEKKVKTLCGLYRSLTMEQKEVFIHGLAVDYAVNHKNVCQIAKSLLEIPDSSSSKILKTEEQLKNLLIPHYSWLFFHIGKIEKGVKFLVDLRTDILNLIAKNAENSQIYEIQQLNVQLKELLSMWFSVGFLELERITWKSPCEMLQKISEYEAVHPVRNWTDLKRRVGPYRRCFIFKHSSMPGEPLVVLHTALAGEISSSMNQIVLSQSKMSGYQSGEKGSFQDAEENPQDIKAAVFYSISSTQKGLQGIELGNYLIKRVVGELQNEFPHMKLFSSLSPIPLFRQWLFERLKIAKRGYNDIFSEEEIRKFQTHFKTSDIYDDLRRSIFTNSWLEDKMLADLLETPLMRLCARYLYLEKRRGYALDSVANFHLKNGAVMWRLNWNANLQPRGLTNSCGIMVNYRYFLEETEMRSTAYVEKQEISASEQIIKYSEEAKHLIRFVNSSKL